MKSQTVACFHSPAQGILSPLPGELSRQYGDCDYDVRHNVSAFGLYQIPFHSRHAALRASPSAAGPSPKPPSFIADFPSPSSASPTPPMATASFKASGPQFARRVPGEPLYRKSPYPGRNHCRDAQWLNPEAFVSVVDPTTGACTGGDSAANCQFGDAGRNTVRGPHFTDSDIYFAQVSAPEGVLRCASTRSSSTPSIIPTSLCPSRSKPACREFYPARVRHA